MSRATKTAPAQMQVDATDFPVDRLQILSRQLSALTVSLYGSGLDNFRTLAPTEQDGILWLVSDMAAEVAALARRVSFGGIAE